MFGFLKKLISSAPQADLGELIANGATIVDVRTPGEYRSGHVKGSVNIPLDQLQKNLKKSARPSRLSPAVLPATAADPLKAS